MRKLRQLRDWVRYTYLPFLGEAFGIIGSLAILLITIGAPIYLGGDALLDKMTYNKKIYKYETKTVSVCDDYKLLPTEEYSKRIAFIENHEDKQFKKSLIDLRDIYVKCQQTKEVRIKTVTYRSTWLWQ